MHLWQRVLGGLNGIDPMIHAEPMIPRHRVAGVAGTRSALLVALFLAQLGHLTEHIAVALTGTAFAGAAANTEEVHLVFNVAIAIGAVVLLRLAGANPWAYALVAVTLLHATEHIALYDYYLRTGISGGAGLLGIGGELPLVPLAASDLHNIYNGVEMILITLGLTYELEEFTDEGRG